MSDSEYRPEVDGLRAVAVLPVVLFHAGVPGFGGGYVGVDVFFVISGYLITGILLRAVQAQHFSIAHFYERRIRRIVPALFAVLAASTVAASWLLFPDEFTNFGKSLFATSLFYANYHFMNDTGYFAAPAEGKPLLHMWSLAVEEQYYLLFPIYVWAAWRWCRRWMLELTVVLALLSLAYSLWLINRSPDQAFYSAPARAWELLAGSVLAMLAVRRPAMQSAVLGNAIAVLGLLLILVPVVSYSDSTLFPAAMALPPVLGTAAVLYASATPGNWVARGLTIALVRFTGLISYSLYLWHWPVFVFCKTYAIRPLSPTEIVGMLAAVVLLAALSWRFVERPFRRGGIQQRRQGAILVGVTTLGMGVACGAAMALGDGWTWRFDPAILQTLEARNNAPAACPQFVPPQDPALRLCTVGSGDASRASFMVWGDSHAEALLPAIEAAARVHGVHGLAFVSGGCPPLLGVRQTREGFRDCAEKADALMNYLSRNPHIEQVILASRWSIYSMGQRFRKEPGHTVYIVDDEAGDASLATNRAVFERGLSRTLERLSVLGREVVLVSQVPESEYRVPLVLARAAHLGRGIEVAPLRSDYEERQAFVEATFARQLSHRRIEFIRPEQWLCRDERCIVATEGRPLYRDSNHLTAQQAMSMATLFNALFRPPAPAAPRAASGSGLRGKPGD